MFCYWLVAVADFIVVMLWCIIVARADELDAGYFVAAVCCRLGRLGRTNIAAAFCLGHIEIPDILA